MTEPYSHRERLEIILAGEKPDRFAASFWRHYFHLESTAEGTIAGMLTFQKEFDWDFMKINPRADYHVQDWGLKLKYSTNELAKHQKLAFPILTADDWLRLKPLAPSAPALDEHLKVVASLRKACGPDLPLLMTVFTPLSLAGRMVPDRTLLLSQLRSEPDKVRIGLEVITETFERYSAELRNAGADGLFFATTQWASADMLTWPEYEAYGLNYDRRIMEAFGETSFNLLHICSSHNYLAQMTPLNYNSTMLSWDAIDPTNPSLPEGLTMAPGKVLVGGFPYDHRLVEMGVDEIRETMQELKMQHDPSKLIIGPGCAIPPDTPVENLRAIRSNL